MDPQEGVVNGSKKLLFKRLTILPSPVPLFIMTTAAIFTTETIVMLLLSQLPSFSAWVQALIDAVLLILLLFPMLYFFMFRPMKLYIAELINTYRELETEMAERKQVEAALRESEKQLRYLSSQLLAAQERERRRVSKELHEELAQSLAAVKLGLRSNERSWRKKGAEIGEEFEQNLKSIDLAIENTRRLSRELSPSVIEDIGLSVALQRQVNNLIKYCHIEVSLDLIDVDRFFSQKAQMIIYRILQEALSNIEKHSQATHLSVVIHLQDHQVSFSVKDNGKGFDLKQVRMKDDSEKGLGLTTMDEGARMVGGSFDIWSKEGEGTRITLTVPLEKDEPLSAE